MTLTFLLGALLIGPAEPEAAPGPPERIVLPVIQPGCDRAGEADTITICGRTDRRFRIDPTTLSAVRRIEHLNSGEAGPRPRSITGGCSDTGLFGCRFDNVLPVSDMALRAIGLAVKAIRGEDLRPALRSGPTDYEIYQAAKADAEEARRE